MNNDPLIFDFAMAQDKPSSFRKDKSNVCPFCDTGNLTDIYEKSGPMIWLHNKFPTLRDTLQTVLIESDDHHGDIASYSKDYNRKLMRFSMHCFEKIAQDSRFKSTLWYKNYGQRFLESLPVGAKKVDLKQINQILKDESINE